MAKRPSNPYPCNKGHEPGRFYYDFTTDYKVPYRAYFSDYGYMFGSHIFTCEFYSFDLVVVGDLLPPDHTPPDPRISDTVRGCFTEVFESLNNVVIAVYDSSDAAEQLRRRKFRMWFNEADLNDIEMVDFELEGEDYNLLSSVFLHINLPDKALILDRYQLILENGNYPLD